MKTINVDSNVFQDFRTMKIEIIGQLKKELSDSETLALILTAVKQYKASFTEVVKQ